MTETNAPVIDTADVVAFATVDRAQCVLLIERDWPPFEGCWALPGGHVDPGEQARDAADRELAEETGVRISTRELSYVGSYDAPGRDPRGPYRTRAYRVEMASAPTPVADDDARRAAWVPLDTLSDLTLAFDHRDIVNAALNQR